MLVSASLSEHLDHHRRNLAALYPECAALQDLTERQACCDERVLSKAGREFCYSQVERDANQFKDCDIKNFVEMFACCDNLAEGDKNLAFDCKKGLDGGGKCPEGDEEACERNYLYGVRVVDEYNQKLLENEKTIKESEGETEDE